VRRSRALWAVGATIAVVAAAGAWLLATRENTTPASIQDALARYRAQAEASDTPIPPGVYVYATTGSESISALGGRKHSYPQRSTVTVTGGDCGMVLRWDVLQHRSNAYAICDDGSRLGAWTETHRFVGRDDVTQWRCEAAAWLPRTVATGATSSLRCTSADSAQRGTTTVVGEETLRVGTADVDVVHLRVETLESGGARGPTLEQRWLERDTGLPVRIAYRVTTLNPSPIGDVRFEERYTLRLVSLEPRR
jgi:hypothetical protein